MLPKCTANKVMNLLVGDIGIIMETCAKISKYKRESVENGVVVDENFVHLLKSQAKLGVAKKVPEGVKAYAIIMTKACLTHKEHLSSKHLDQHGIIFNVVEEIELYNKDRTARRNVKYRLKVVIKKIRKITR
jgi:hypothetical protein